MANPESPVVDPAELEQVRQAAGGDAEAWASLLERHGKRLKRMVALRLDHRLRGRVDPSDVLQEAMIQAARALPGYVERADLPVFLWLRWLTGKTLQTVHRGHLGVQARDANREVRISDENTPAASSIALAAQLLGRDTQPFDAAIKAERRRRVQEALDALEAIDREVLTLRHFEELSNAETAQVLALTEGAVSKRYLRALRRIKAVLSTSNGAGDSLA